jgi:hypothetical protein
MNNRRSSGKWRRGWWAMNNHRSGGEWRRRWNDSDWGGKRARQKERSSWRCWGCGWMGEADGIGEDETRGGGRDVMGVKLVAKSTVFLIVELDSNVPIVVRFDKFRQIWVIKHDFEGIEVLFHPEEINRRGGSLNSVVGQRERAQGNLGRKLKLCDEVLEGISLINVNDFTIELDDCLDNLIVRLILVLLLIIAVLDT